MNSQTVHFLVEFEIHEGKFDDFAATAKIMTDGTARESGALGYEWFVSHDRKHCRLLETYANADAVQAHLQSAVVREWVPKIVAFATISRFEVYGTPNEASAKELSAFGAKIYQHWHGLPSQQSGSTVAAAD